MPLSAAESFIYATVRITTFTGGKPLSTGTGFFWNTHKGQEGFVTNLVTNKHVVAGADMISIACHTRYGRDGEIPSGKFINFNVQLDPAGVIYHPNPDTDIVALNIGHLIHDTSYEGHFIFVKAFDAALIPSAETWQSFDAIEEVLMVGCPRGIMDEVNNHPIVRRGITATQLCKDYNGKPEFMVDMACFPGSSGSPVIMSQTNYSDKAGNLTIGRRIYFLGLLYQGPLVTNQGVIKFGNTPSVEVAAMMHLGNVVRSTELKWIDAEIHRLMGTQDALTAQSHKASN